MSQQELVQVGAMHQMGGLANENWKKSTAYSIVCAFLYNIWSSTMKAEAVSLHMSCKWDFKHCSSGSESHETDMSVTRVLKWIDKCPSTHPQYVLQVGNRKLWTNEGWRVPVGLLTLDIGFIACCDFHNSGLILSFFRMSANINQTFSL
jgi:hypothetical protein